MPLRIASLGSSFAAGPGIPPQVDHHASRSGNNYANIVARALGAELTDLAVSSATLDNIIDAPQERNGHVFPPQIGQLDPTVNIVLVLGGGNDVGYIGGLLAETEEHFWPTRTLHTVRSLIPFLTTTAHTQIDYPSTEELAARYGAVLDRIHAKAPGALIVVVEYLTVLGHHTRPGKDVPFHLDRVDHYRTIADKVDRATSQAIQERQAWCWRAPVAEKSRQHGLGSPEPWVSGWSWKLLRTVGAFHPNARGMRAVSDIILSQLEAAGVAGVNSSLTHCVDG